MSATCYSVRKLKTWVSLGKMTRGHTLIPGKGWQDMSCKPHAGSHSVWACAQHRFPRGPGDFSFSMADVLIYLLIIHCLVQSGRLKKQEKSCLLMVRWENKRGKWKELVLPKPNHWCAISPEQLSKPFFGLESMIFPSRWWNDVCI